MRRPVLSVATVLATIVLSVTAAQPALASSGATGGSIVIQLQDEAGAPIRSANIETAALGIRGIEADAVTDDRGLVTLGPIEPAQTVVVATRNIPRKGAATYTPGRREGIVVEAGTTTRTSLTLAIGATVHGSVVDPTGPAKGKTLYAFNQDDTNQVFSAVSDAAGQYDFVGLGTGRYAIFAYAQRDADPAQWKTRVEQQSSSGPASHVTLSSHYVHSAYDLAVSASSPGRMPDPELSGATVRATNVATSSSYATRFSSLLDSEQTGQFIIPSGTYILELVTTATTSTPSRDLWLTRTSDGFRWLPDRASALPITVHYPYWTGWGAEVTAAGSA